MSTPRSLAETITPLTIAGRTHQPTAQPLDLAITEVALDVWFAWDATITWVLAATTPTGPELVIGREAVGPGEQALASAARRATDAINERFERWARTSLVMVGLVANPWVRGSDLCRAAEGNAYGVHVQAAWRDWPSQPMRALVKARDAIRGDHARRYQARPVVVATDASMRRGHDVAGIAYVNDVGDVGHDVVRARDVFEAEVLAIVLALIKTRPRQGRPLVIRTDSRCAERYVRAVLTGRPSDHLGPASPRRFGLAAEIVARARRFADGVRIEWTKGHAGDVLNESADRLAVLARRSRTDGGTYPPEVIARARREVAADARASRFTPTPTAI